MSTVPQHLLNCLQPNAAAANSHDSPKVELEDATLWNKFQVLTNEMIVTKNGRRMFPVIKVTNFIFHFFFINSLNFGLFSNHNAKTMKANFNSQEIYDSNNQ